MATKLCGHCHNYKDIDDFGVDRQKSDGRHSHCRLCRRGYRLLRKPVPTWQVHVNTMRPRRTSVTKSLWDLYDSLTAANVIVTVILPDTSSVVWSELE